MSGFVRPQILTGKGLKIFNVWVQICPKNAIINKKGEGRGELRLCRWAVNVTLTLINKSKKNMTMKDKKFNYKNASNDHSPRVLITTENQHVLRGFNIHYMTPKQIGTIRDEWRMVRNQPWSTSTKERVVIRRAGKFAQNSFRSYRKPNITKWYNS